MLGFFQYHMVDLYKHNIKHEETVAKVGFDPVFSDSQEKMLPVE